MGSSGQQEAVKLLGHGELARASPDFPEYDCYQSEDNSHCFRADYIRGVLACHDRGTFVVYQHGVLAGSGSDRDYLFNEADARYGSSSLTVFKIPGEGQSFEDALKEARGVGLK